MKKYLIIKLSAIGDVIMAMPMVTKIREEEPDSHITWICGKTVYPLLNQLPIDELICIDERNLLRGSKTEKMAEVWNVWRYIAGKYFDVVAMCHADWRYHILTCFTKAGIFNSFGHVIGKTWPIPGRWHTDEYVRMIAKHLDKEESIVPYQFKVNSDTMIDKVLRGKRNIITLTPDGAKNIMADDFCRRWPIENYVKLAKMLIMQKMTVVISGAKSDNWISPYFADIPVVNLIDKTSLNGLIYLFSQSDVVVTYDSGPMHIAGMTNCRVIALFGPTDPNEKVPRRDGIQYIWERDKYSCCPCYDGKNYALCRDNICLKNITPNFVMHKIKDSLKMIGR